MSLLVICNIVLLVVVCLVISGCGTSRKVERMQERQMRAEIGMVEEIPGRDGNDGEVGNDGRSPVGAGDNGRDTTVVMEAEGPIIMNAVRDEDGNMVATDVLEAASVTQEYCGERRQGEHRVCRDRSAGYDGSSVAVAILSSDVCA